MNFKSKCSKTVCLILLGVFITKTPVCHASFFGNLLGSIARAAADAVVEIEEAKEEARAAIEQENAEQAQRIREEQKRKEIEHAKEQLALAKKGEKASQETVAGYFEAGNYGFPKDLKQAFYWYKKAAEQGRHYSQKVVANCYAQGIGVRKNIKEAFKWYIAAAKNDNEDCKIYLGDCYLLGGDQHNGQNANNVDLSNIPLWTLECNPDYSKAVTYYSDIFEHNSYGDKALEGMVHLRLGWCYLTGSGCDQDGEQALAMFYAIAKSYEKVDVKKISKYRVFPVYLNFVFLARCYYEGIGCEANPKLAKKMLKKAQKILNVMDEEAYNIPVLNFERQIYGEAEDFVNKVMSKK